MKNENLEKAVLVNKSIIFKNIVKLLLPALFILGALYVHILLPNINPLGYETKIYPRFLQVILIIYVCVVIISYFLKRLRNSLLKQSYLNSMFILLMALYDLFTIKLGTFPLPFFPSPDKILFSMISDWQMLLTSIVYSLRLLLCGYFFGGICGFFSGIMIGWSKHCSYWMSPFLKIIGPIPATAWIPIVMVAFPTSFSASVFLVSLCVWFPVTVMTSSGIQNVNKSWIEGAQILGTSQLQLIFRVAVPAAMPNIFIGMFMGLGTSFVTLIAAEMLGVKAGLGWYITWANSWAEYSKVFAALIIIAILFSSLIKLLFILRDHLLKWQRGLLKW